MFINKVRQLLLYVLLYAGVLPLSAELLVRNHYSVLLAIPATAVGFLVCRKIFPNGVGPDWSAVTVSIILVLLCLAIDYFFRYPVAVSYVSLLLILYVCELIIKKVQKQREEAAE